MNFFTSNCPKLLLTTLCLSNLFATETAALFGGAKKQSLTPGVYSEIQASTTLKPLEAAVMNVAIQKSNKSAQKEITEAFKDKARLQLLIDGGMTPQAALATLEAEKKPGRLEKIRSALSLAFKGILGTTAIVASCGLTYRLLKFLSLRENRERLALQGQQDDREWQQQQQRRRAESQQRWQEQTARS